MKYTFVIIILILQSPAAWAQSNVIEQHAIALYNRGQKTEAAQAFRRILKLDPSNQLAQSYLDKLDPASQIPQTKSKIHPSPVKAKAKPSSAVNSTTQSIRIHPESPKEIQNLEQTLQALKDRVKELESAIHERDDLIEAMEFELRDIQEVF